MTDLSPNDLSHLSDEEFNALAPQGYHATGSAEPLSPAAQTVLNAVREICPAPADEIAAAALRAAADQAELLPLGAVALTVEDMVEQQIRRKLLAIAAELDNNSTHK